MEQQENIFTDEQKQLQEIANFQKKTSDDQRKILTSIAHTRKELAEIEKKRYELKEKRSSHKTQLLVSASDHIFKMTQYCANSKTLSLPCSELQSIIIAISQLIQKLMDTKNATESSDEIILRQNFYISAIPRTLEMDKESTDVP